MEQRRNNIKVTFALLFLFISPSWSFFLPFNTEPAARIIVRKQHLLQYPSSRRYVLTQNLQHDQFLGFSPSLKSQGGFIPYYSTNGQVVLNEVQPAALPAALPAFPAAPALPTLPAAPALPALPVLPVVTEAPTTLPPPPPTTTAAPVTTAAPTTTPEPTTTTAAPPPPAPETPAPEIPAPAPPAPEVPVAAPAPVAVAAPAPQIVTIQPSQGFPQGIIAVQPIITHGGFLNLGSHGQAAAFPAQGLANNAALSFLQSLLGQHLPAAAPAAPAPAEPEAPAAPEPVATEAPVMVIVTEAPTTTAAPTTPAPPVPAPAPARPEITFVVIPAPQPAPVAPAYLPPANQAPAPAQTIPQGLFPQGWNFGQNAGQPSVSDNDKFLINVPEFNQPKSEATPGDDGAESNYKVVVNHNSGADASIRSSFSSFRPHHIKSAQPAAVHNYVYGQKFQHEQPLVGSQATGPAGHYDFGYASNNHYVAQGRKYRRESS
ncbi:uncharacterized protein LOC135934320 [Cloeon dipterum]|uniref:uncharacterized protein LOC135934320 n=1 Tax=Cloeon dipterum TaxID=197152 RepID=UPI00321F68F8